MGAHFRYTPTATDGRSGGSGCTRTTGRSASPPDANTVCVLCCLGCGSLGKESPVRTEHPELRPIGGAVGCLALVLASVLLTVALAFLFNALL